MDPIAFYSFILDNRPCPVATLQAMKTCRSAFINSTRLPSSAPLWAKRARFRSFLAAQPNVDSRSMQIMQKVFRQLGPFVTNLFYANGVTNILVKPNIKIPTIVGDRGSKDNFWGQYLDTFAIAATKSNKEELLQTYTHLHELGHTLCHILSPDNIYTSVFLKDWNRLTDLQKQKMLHALGQSQNDPDKETREFINRFRQLLTSKKIGNPTELDLVRQKASEAYMEFSLDVAKPLISLIMNRKADGENVDGLHKILSTAFPTTFKAFEIIDHNQEMECAFSDNATFQKAYEKGILALWNETDPKKPQLKSGGELYIEGKVVDNIAYYIPQKIAGVAVGGDFPEVQASREEMFSQLFAEILLDENHPTSMRRLFPDAAKLVEQLVSTLGMYNNSHATSAPSNEIYSLGVTKYSIPYTNPLPPIPIQQ